MTEHAELHVPRHTTLTSFLTPGEPAVSGFDGATERMELVAVRRLDEIWTRSRDAPVASS